MLKRIAIAFAAGIAVLLLVIATRPANFRIERSAAMTAPAWLVFSHINDFRQWPSWSPWEKLDPAMKKTFGDKAAGVGAVYSWAGNDDVGEGRMTITETTPAQQVKIKLEFFKPFAATNQAIFTLTPHGSSTSVQWAMEGENNFMAKAFSLFCDMDALVGKDFEKGLSSLQGVVEAEEKRRQEEKKKVAEALEAAGATRTGSTDAQSGSEAAAPVGSAALPQGGIKPAAVPPPATD